MYDNIVLYNVDCELSMEFFENFKHWMSLKMFSCTFKSYDFYATFFENLAPQLEIECNIVGLYQSRSDNSLPIDHSIKFPKLLKLKYNALPVKFTCTTLKTLETYLVSEYENPALSTLKTNLQLEDLNISCDVFEEIFKNNFLAST